MRFSQTSLRATATAGALAALAALPACSLWPADSAAPGAAADEITLHAKQPLAGWRVTINDIESQATLTGGSATVPKPAQPRVPDSVVSLRVSGKSGPDDALTMQWKGAWLSSLRIEGGKPLDLRPFLADGTLEFDLNAIDQAKAGLTFAMSCGTDCVRKVPYVLPSRALQGRGWQHLSFALRCFARDGDDFSAVPQPFMLDSSGTGEAAIANIRFVRHGKPNTPCADYRTESVTPTPLTQVWALDWWMKRHQEKLDAIQALKAAGQNSELVFIGDSITHGWEDAGKAVWEQRFKKYNALDLGFGGDHTENVLWRLQHGEIDGIRPKVAVLMIGTNNTGDRQEDPRTTAAGIRRLLQEIRQRTPDTRILLLAVFPRDEKPDSPLRRLNDRVNGLISGYADGQKVFFLNINESLMNPDGTLSKDVMPDLLHLSDKGYGIWARSIEPTLSKLLAQN
jgi:beta-glucosidase